ncbi:MAG: hypothetical protein M1817_004291 [Caeruleum heppii]|nr:MAG: hypothetical protein M1817_004291 [Caeruleum heppii]
MATPAHCLYCFDVLTASLDHREPLTLRQIQTSWRRYLAARTGDLDDVLPPRVDIAMEDADEADNPDDIEDEDDPPRAPHRLRTGFDRLVVPSPSSASSSSSPSSLSTSSSRTPVSTLASSSNSSRSSFFSPSRRRSNQHPLPTVVTEPERPLFVTWNTVGRRGSKSLRGCIGTFEAHELESGLRSYALTSAFDDSRFMPITSRELSSLEVGVTLLTDFETAPTPTSWDLGTHGLRISFAHHGKRYGATYLPDVPVDQGWTREETLVSLMRKAGWNGKKDDWRKVGDLKVVRYQGKKETVSWQEWCEWRGWWEKSGGR